MQSYAQINTNPEDFDDLNIATRFSMAGRISAHEFMQSLNNEEKQRYLDLKVKHKDGTYGSVISTKDKEHYYCHVCEIQTNDFENMKSHINGKKHRGNVLQLSEPKLNTTKEEIEESDEYIPKLAPGEPVPPGFEDKVRCVTQIQKELDEVKTKPLIGLEFLLELTDELGNSDPKYVCLLCEKKGEHHVVLNHLTSFEHYNKYVGMYFPTASKAITTEFPANKVGKKAASIVLTNICNAIESKYGRLQPMAVDKHTFEAKKNKYLAQILEDRHFREKPGETFVELVDKNLLGAPEPNSNDVLAPRDDKFKEDNSSVFNKGKTVVAQVKDKNKDTGSKVTAAVNYDNSTMKHSKEKDSPRRQDKSHPSKNLTGRKEKESLSSISSTSISRSRSRSGSRRRSRGRSRSKSLTRIKSRGRSRSKSPPRRKLRERSRSYSPQFSKTVYKSYQKETKVNSSKFFPKQRYKGFIPFQSSYSRFHWKRSPSRSRSRSRSQPRIKSRSKTPVRSYRRRRSSTQSPPSNRVSPKRKCSVDTQSEADVKDKWNTFRYEFDKIEREAAKLLKFHEHNPEKHPLYPDEWKKFWNMRYKELQAEGKDPNKHDFKPEWIEYWNKRMLFLHKEDVKNKKEELKVKLGLPVEELETVPPSKKRTVIVPAKDVLAKPSSEMKMKFSPDIKEKPIHEIPVQTVPIRQVPIREIPVKVTPVQEIPVRDALVSEKVREAVRDALVGEKVRDRQIRQIRVTESPVKENPRKETLIKDSPVRETQIKEKLVREKSFKEKKRTKEFDEATQDVGKGSKKKDKEEPSKNIRCSEEQERKSKRIKESKEADIVPILRLLTAMESQLGSLGPKVNNLMGKALSLEKIKSHSADSLLAIPENIVLFETVKEKLKGQLIAGIVEKNMLSATKACLDMLENALEKAEKNNFHSVAVGNPQDNIIKSSGNISLVPDVQSFPLAPVTVSPIAVTPKVDPFDKLAISQQIAAALVAEGKTDVTEDELEQLINAVTAMAQASKGSGSVISTAQFVALQKQQPLGMEAVTKSPATPLQQLLTVVTSKMSSPFSGTPKDSVSGLQLLQTAYDEPKLSPVANTLVKSEKQHNFSPHGTTKMQSSANQNSKGQDISHLSEVELQTLLQNFKDLSAHEQQCLITYLRKLEETEPARVEQLRKYVVLDTRVKQTPVVATSKPTISPERANIIDNKRPKGSHEHVDSTFMDQKENKKKFDVEDKSKMDDLDSDDDYTYEEIYAAASKKVKESEEAKAKEREKEKACEKLTGATEARNDDPAALLQQTKAMIANLMGQFPAKYSQKQVAASPSPRSEIPPTNSVVMREGSQSRIGTPGSTGSSTHNLSGPYSSVQPSPNLTHSELTANIPSQQHLSSVQQANYPGSYSFEQGTNFSSTMQFQNNYANNYDNSYYPNQPVHPYQSAEQFQQGYGNFQSYSLPAQNTFQNDGLSHNSYQENLYQGQSSGFYQGQPRGYY